MENVVGIFFHDTKMERMDIRPFKHEDYVLQSLLDKDKGGNAGRNRSGSVIVRHTPLSLSLIHI